MPKVGSRTFAYTPKGEAAARAEAKRTGKPLVNTQAKDTTMAKGKGKSAVEAAFLARYDKSPAAKAQDKKKGQVEDSPEDEASDMEEARAAMKKAKGKGKSKGKGK